MGVVFQQPTLDLDLTVVQNLRYFAAMQGKTRRAAESRIELELDRLALEEFRHQNVRQLSGDIDAVSRWRALCCTNPPCCCWTNRPLDWTFPHASALLIALAFGIDIPLAGFVTVVPALILSGLTLGAFGLLLSSSIRQLENFAGMMNFVIVPMFFMSSALYPLRKIQESSVTLYQVCSANPFTHAVELIRFALYSRVNIEALVFTAFALVLFQGLALYGYSPAKGIMRRKAGPGD